MELRRYSIEEKEKIHRFILNTMVDVFKGVKTEGSIREELADIDNISGVYGNNFMVTTDGANIVGTAGIKRINEGEYELKRVYVDREYRHKGYARTMINELLHIAHDAQARVVVCRSGIHLADAHRMYEKIGFIKQGEVNRQIVYMYKL